jgi:hypothetical protein
VRTPVLIFIALKTSDLTYNLICLLKALNPLSFTIATKIISASKKILLLLFLKLRLLILDKQNPCGTAVLENSVVVHLITKFPNFYGRIIIVFTRISH